ncbi:hypothetical protein [Flagellimonas onchidii]|uniref:hypothetical protein n=1 Tax=Flagellimonas onchidii TaxID=2562684 RepID=UPI0010A5D6AF|nr:hypothetical protein [Allomuricauda onchidii]
MAEENSKDEEVLSDKEKIEQSAPNEEEHLNYQNNEKGNQEKFFLALDEANRWSRHVDNYFWAISSFVVSGQVIIAYHYYNLQEGSIILLIPLSMIIGWILFNQFIRNTKSQLKYLNKVINRYENCLGIDVVPNFEKPGTEGFDFLKLMTIMYPCSVIFWIIIFLIKVIGLLSFKHLCLFLELLLLFTG